MKSVKVREYKSKRKVKKVKVPVEMSEFYLEMKQESKKYKPPFPRYYYWENVGSPYGIRQMGRDEGYSSIKELMKEEKFSFEQMKKGLAPFQIWILEARPIYYFESTVKKIKKYHGKE